MQGGYKSQYDTFPHPASVTSKCAHHGPPLAQRELPVHPELSKQARTVTLSGSSPQNQ